MIDILPALSLRLPLARALREVPSAELSITLPILLAGLALDEDTPIVDVSQTEFGNAAAISGKGNALKKWRIVHAHLSGVPMSQAGPHSPTGPTLQPAALAAADDE